LLKTINVMSNKLYVGNLSFDTTEIDLQDTFAQAGTVSEVALMQDKFTGRSRGFAFVTMSSADEAQKAISLFHGKTVQGRPLTVNEARPREERSGGGGGGGERRSYGGGGGGGGGERRGGGGGGGGGYSKRY
jgi:cold-inducible RNA-binding protein